MNSFRHGLCVGALLAGLVAAPAHADGLSSAGISASVSTSVGSVSDSFGRSSAGSSRHGGQARADGDFRIVEVTPVAERPGIARMKLQAVAQKGEDAELDLYLPQRVVDQTHLAAGQRVSATQRPYGVEFALREPRQAFFLVLDDDWLRELPPRAVAL
jgi:hypothetical protein